MWLGVSGHAVSCGLGVLELGILTQSTNRMSFSKPKHEPIRSAHAASVPPARSRRFRHPPAQATSKSKRSGTDLVDLDIPWPKRPINRRERAPRACLGVSVRAWACLDVSGRVWACLDVSGRAWACLGVSSNALAVHFKEKPMS